MQDSPQDFRALDAIDAPPINPPPAPPQTTVLALTIGDAESRAAIVAVRYDVKLLTPGDPLFGEVPLFETHYRLLGTDHLPASAGYPQVAQRVNQLAKRLYDRDDRGDYHVLVDASDVGRPVVDTIRGSIIPQVMVTAVTVKTGDSGDLDALWRSETSIGLSYLISRARAILQGNRLHVPADQRVLLDGLESYDIDTGGIELVRALALALASEFQPIRYGLSPDILPSARM